LGQYLLIYFKVCHVTKTAHACLRGLKYKNEKKYPPYDYFVIITLIII